MSRYPGCSLSPYWPGGVEIPQLRTVKPKPKVKIYPVLARCVEEGVGYGMHRAFKHTETPSHEAICEQVEQAVMNALCEALDLGEE